MIALMPMRVAGIARVRKRPFKPSERCYPDVAGASAHNLDTGTVQYIHSALSHIAGKHDLDTIFRKNLRDIGFASAACRGLDSNFINNRSAGVIDGYDSKILTMAEMVINLILP